MSILRSLPRSGSVGVACYRAFAYQSGSQPNLSINYLESPKSNEVAGCKYYEHYGNYEIKNDIKDMRERLSQMMEVMTALSNNQLKFMSNVAENISKIKEEVTTMKQMTNKLNTELSDLTENVTNLKSRTLNTERKIEIIEADIAELKTNESLTITGTDAIEEMLAELKEREERSKNIIIVGLQEPLFHTRDERKRKDNEDVLRITKTINTECPDPENIIRLGQYNPNKNRPLKVCFKSHETALSVLRNKKILDSKAIKIFSDQTPQQQAYLRNQQEELKRRINGGENGLTIKYIKNVPIITKQTYTTHP